MVRRFDTLRDLVRSGGMAIVRRMRGAALAVVAVGGLGCMDSGGGGAALPSFHDLTTAPAAIQKASLAVVRIHTAGEYGTGSFISPTGLLLTNNHVLGDTVCPIEGCSIQLSFNFQRGQPFEQVSTVYAIPVAVDVGLDMALVQIHTSTASSPILSTPNFLNIVPHDPSSLLGTRITIVGHPESRLKKWTSGEVVDAFGNWFSSTAYILPGDSGSPVLDDGGNLVGIIHRLSTGEDLISNEGVNVMATGTASAPLQTAMAVAALPAAMISVLAPTTAQAVVASDLVYLNAHAETANVNGAVSDVLSLLGAACDAALARTDFASPDDLATALQPCNDALTWIECRTDQSPAAYGTVCPSADATLWTARFQKMNDLWVAMNGNTDLTPVTFGLAQLAFTKAAGTAQGSASLQAALAVVGNPGLDFGLSNYVAAFDVATYAGTDTLGWLRAYRKAPGYQDYGTSIASAYLWWWDNDVIGQDEAVAALDALIADPNISIGAKLYADENLYEDGK